MTDDARQLIEMAVGLRRRSLTAEQRERRRVVDERNARMQEKGILRGPNAHPDGTFGKVRKAP